MHRHTRATLGIALVAAVLALSACTSSNSSNNNTTSGGVATYALPPGLIPTSIFPLVPGSVNSSYISIEDFQYLIWRPLYWFGNGSQPTINYSLSLANPPTFDQSGRTVTIHLKHILWSDGRVLTNRDVAFWINMLLAERTNYFNYTPGYFPDDLVSESYPASDPSTFSLTFNAAYSHTWLLYNQLSEIIPLPQHSWDKTSSSGKIGNYDLTRKGAAAVWNYLSAQNRDRSSYATNPLWRVVDGPWYVSQFNSSTGFTRFAPNKKYFAGAPHLQAFEELPFTSDAAEYNELRSGGIDYGYIPYSDAAASLSGYSLEPWTQWGFNFAVVNFTNPKVGPLLRQLYIRQAMERLIDQSGYIHAFLHGYGHIVAGPVPLTPASPFASPFERTVPYAYNPTAASTLLTSHGWVNSGGTAVCMRPGTAANECGTGIALKTPLSLNLLYASGSSQLTDMVTAMQSSFAKAGIHLSLSSGLGSTVISQATPCQSPPSGTGCSWEIIDYAVNGFGWTYSPEYYPTGEPLYIPGAAANSGGYDDPHATALIHNSTLQSSLAALYRYEDYMALQLPSLWMPSEYYQLSAISDKLHGTLPQDPNVQIYPEDWTLSK